MIIQSKVRRNAWINVALGFVPELLIAWAITRFMGEGWWLFFAVFFGLLAAYVLIWLKNSLWAWAVFLLFGRRNLARWLLSYLKEQKYPEPPRYIESPKDYFLEVARNNTVPDDTRIDAAINVGALDSMTALGQVQSAIRFSMALEDAIHAYKAGLAS